MCLTVSTSEITVRVDGRLARIICYLIAQGAELDLDATPAGKLLLMWTPEWLRLRKEVDFPPQRENAGL